MRVPSAILLIVLLGSPASRLLAQRIHGTVKNEATGQPVVAASVALLDERGKQLEQVLTDSAGTFLLEPDYAGAYGLRAEGLGYKASQTGPVPVDYGELVEVILTLGVDAVPLQPLKVSARSHPPDPYLTDAGFYERRRGGAGVFITREEIMRRRPEEFSDVLRTLPGISVRTTGPAGRRGFIMTTRSNGRCQPALILDGTPTVIGGTSPLRGHDVPLDDAVVPSDIEGLELYRGPAGIPPEFNVNNGFCGVLVIWTRRN